MKKMIDGWKIAGGYDVYVEDGKVLRGIKLDHNGHDVPAYPYRLMRDGSWSREIGVTLAAFRAAARRGTMQME